MSANQDFYHDTDALKLPLDNLHRFCNVNGVTPIYVTKKIGDTFHVAISFQELSTGNQYSVLFDMNKATPSALEGRRYSAVEALNLLRKFHQAEPIEKFGKFGKVFNCFPSPLLDPLKNKSARFLSITLDEDANRHNQLIWYYQEFFAPSIGKDPSEVSRKDIFTCINGDATLLDLTNAQAGNKVRRGEKLAKLTASISSTEPVTSELVDISDGPRLTAQFFAYLRTLNNINTSEDHLKLLAKGYAASFVGLSDDLYSKLPGFHWYEFKQNKEERMETQRRRGFFTLPTHSRKAQGSKSRNAGEEIADVAGAKGKNSNGNERY